MSHLLHVRERSQVSHAPLDKQRPVSHDVLMNRARVFEEALALPKGDRLKLAAELLASSPPPGILAEGSLELAEEIDERIASVRAGRTKPIPARQALAKLRQRKTRR